jgi:hypothetical protein
MHEQALEHIDVSAQVRPAAPAGFVQMRARPFQEFPASAEESPSSIAANPSAIRINSVAFGFLIGPRLAATIRFADIGPNLKSLEIVHGGSAVIALVGYDFLDHRDGVAGDAGASNRHSIPSSWAFDLSALGRRVSVS